MAALDGLTTCYAVEWRKRGAMKASAQKLLEELSGKPSKKYVDDDEYESLTGKKPEYEDDEETAAGEAAMHKGKLFGSPGINLTIVLGKSKKA